MPKMRGVLPMNDLTKDDVKKTPFPGITVTGNAVVIACDSVSIKENKERREVMNFSKALELIKSGELLKRAGWNGKDQFVFLVKGSEFKVNRDPLLSIFDEGTDIVYRPHIDMKYQDGSIGVWLSSMGDLMAEDWVMVD